MYSIFNIQKVKHVHKLNQHLCTNYILNEVYNHAAFHFAYHHNNLLLHLKFNGVIYGYMLHEIEGSFTPTIL